MTRSPKSKLRVVPKVDLTAPDAVAQFERAADVFMQNILNSPDPKKAALDVMVREGILTPGGRLTKNYR